jgi:hypothetical protein
LSPETLTAYIAPGEVVGLHRRGWRASVVGRYLEPCALAAGPDKPDYVAVTAALREAIAASSPDRLQIVLSNHWVRYLVHAWRDDAENMEEQGMLARMRFAEIYGAIAEGWSIVMSDEAPGRPRLVAAIDGLLLDALTDVAGQAGVTLKSVEPLLVSVANAACRQYGQRGARWLAVHEAGRLTFALLDGDQWRWVRSQRVGADWVAGFSLLLAQEVLRAGQGGDAEAVVFAPLATGVTFEARPGQLARMLTPSSGGEGLDKPDPRFGYVQVLP